MESNGVDEVMIFTGDLKRSRAMTDDGKEKFNDGIMSAADKICCMLYVQPNKCYYFFFTNARLKKCDRCMFDIGLHHLFFYKHSVSVCEELIVEVLLVKFCPILA